MRFIGRSIHFKGCMISVYIIEMIIVRHSDGVERLFLALAIMISLLTLKYPVTTYSNRAF